jgi:hypothetical protein
MTGSQYEQYVRAVLARKLKLSPEALRSAKEPGTTLPDGSPVSHQIDLLFTEHGAVADYVTIIECKYRSSAPVDQEEVAKLAFVKGSMKASKAILVTNTMFTKGADAIAGAEKIALLVVKPRVERDALALVPPSAGADELFREMERLLSTSDKAPEVVVVRRICAGPDDGHDLLESLLRDEEVREAATAALRDPRIRDEISKAARDNPALAEKALGFLRRGRF